MSLKKSLAVATLGLLCWIGAACADGKDVDPRSLGIGIFQVQSTSFAPTLIFQRTSAEQAHAAFDGEHYFRFFWMDEKDLSDISKAVRQLDGQWGKCPGFEERSKVDAFRVRWSMADAIGDFCIPVKDAGALFGELDRASASSSNKEFRLWLSEMMATLKSQPVQN